MIQEFWDISPLYKGFDDPTFLEHVEQLRKYADELVAFAETLEQVEPLEGLRRGTELLEKLALLNDRLPLYCRLRLATNLTDAEATAWQGKLSAINATFAGAEASFKLWAGKLPNLEALLEQDEILKEYKFFYTQLAETGKYLMSSDREAAVAAMNNSTAWSNMRAALTSRVKVEFRGKTETITSLRNKEGDEDPEVRREAFEAELAAYEQVKDPVAHAMNALKMATITESRMRGYESPLAWTLNNDRLQKKTLDAMMEAVKDSLPQLQRYLKAKAKIIGKEGPLAWYDIGAPVGTYNKKFTTTEARDMLLNMFYNFDEELGSMMDTAFRDAWIDFPSRPGKRDGAFCASCRSLGRSWVMTNYSGSLGGVKTLAHELGHAFHNVAIKEHRPLNKKYGRPVSETASIFNECVFYDAIISQETDPQNLLSLLNSYLNAEATLVMDIYSRFLFEDEVFKRRENEFLSADILCDIMTRAQKTAYGDALDPEKGHPYMWICKPHYYGYFYYNYPYIFGRLFSHGLYAIYQKEGPSFVPKYKKLLFTTGVATAEEAAMVAGIDLTDKAFWQGSLNDLIKMIDRFCDLAGV